MLTAVTTVLVAPSAPAGPLQEPQSSHQPPALDCVINPSVVADLGSGVPGVLSDIRVDRSDIVRAGDVVAELESGVEVAARDLAKLRAGKDTEIELRRVNDAFGRRQYARSQDLFKRKVISTNDMDERKTESLMAGIQLRQAVDNKELAALELRRAEQVLKRRRIESPISGVVMERFKTIGEYVDDQPILRVAQLNPLHVEVFVPVEQLGEIRPGMRADVWSDAVTGSDWDAKVSRVDRVADVASGTYGVRLVLPNPDYRVPAGLRCQLRFRAADADEVADDWPMLLDDNAGRAEVVADAESDSGDRTDRAKGPALSQGAMLAVDDPAAADVDDNAQASATPATMCRRIGPFSDRAAAEAAADDLRAEGLDVRVDPMAAIENVGYRVVSETFDKRADAKALVARLKRSGVKDYFLAPGTQAPLQVALGLYQSKRAADRRVRDLAKRGIEATLQPWSRESTKYTLSVFGRPTAVAIKQLNHLPVPADGRIATHPRCEQLARR